VILLASREKRVILCKVLRPTPQPLSLPRHGTEQRDRTLILPVESTFRRKRLLIVGSTCFDTDQRSEYLRLRGYDVDCTPDLNAALDLSRSHTYDLIVLALDPEDHSISKVAEQLKRINPNSTITCLADCKKPIPPLPCHSMLWMGEPLEYFAARVEALSAA